METARCRAVLAAAETGSFSRAAEVLRYTPSGVNQLVTAFENELGFSVFRRSTKGVSLTENGQLLLPRCGNFYARRTAFLSWPQRSTACSSAA